MRWNSLYLKHLLGRLAVPNHIWIHHWNGQWMQQLQQHSKQELFVLATSNPQIFLMLLSELQKALSHTGRNWVTSLYQTLPIIPFKINCKIYPKIISMWPISSFIYNFFSQLFHYHFARIFLVPHTNSVLIERSHSSVPFASCFSKCLFLFLVCFINYFWKKNRDRIKTSPKLFFSSDFHLGNLNFIFWYIH